MDASLLSTIYPIESNREGDNTVGTGFLIHQYRQTSYFLTCAHVVESIGGEHLQINGIAARVEAIGASNDLDLAMLAIPGFSYQPVAELINTGKVGDPITIAGIYDYGQHRSRKPIRGCLDSQSSLKKPKAQGKWIKAWELRLETDEYLQPGYSGSPVVHDASRRVIAVVSHRRGQGDRGLAISVEAIHELWQPNMQPGWTQILLSPQSKSDEQHESGEKMQGISAWEIERINRQISSLKKTWNILAEKIEALEIDRGHENRSDEVDRLGHVINKTRAQQAEVEEEILSLEAKLQKLKA